MPGVLSARWSGGAGDVANLELVLAQLGDIPDERLGAQFRCAVALVLPDGREAVVHGEMRGRLVREPRGTNGFGYDPIFVPDGESRTSAEMSSRGEGRDQPPRQRAARPRPGPARPPARAETCCQTASRPVVRGESVRHDARMTGHADAHGLETSRRLRVLAGVGARACSVAAYLLLVLTPSGSRGTTRRWWGGCASAAADRAEVGPLPQVGRHRDPGAHGRRGGVVVGLVRRRARLALLAGGAFFAAVLSAELLKAVLPRPSYGTELAILASKEYDTYPSGHATIATGFVLALVMVNNNRWRPLVALLGVLWSSAVATGVVAAGWHRPSDAIGGIALATAWLSLPPRSSAASAAWPAEPGRLRSSPPVPRRALALLVVVTAVVLALTSSQARQPADVAWWAFPIGQITIDLTAIAAEGTYAWLLKALRFGDPGRAQRHRSRPLIRRPTSPATVDDQSSGA